MLSYSSSFRRLSSVSFAGLTLTMLLSGNAFSQPTEDPISTKSPTKPQTKKADIDDPFSDTALPKPNVEGEKKPEKIPEVLPPADEGKKPADDKMHPSDLPGETPMGDMIDKSDTDTGGVDPKLKAGLEMIDEHKFAEAAKHFKELVKKDPKLATAHSLLALSYRLMEQYDEALEEYGEALRLSPDDSEVFYRRGIVWFQKGEFGIAMDDFNEVLGFNDRDARAYLWIGYCHLEQGNVGRAFDAYSRAIKYDPELIIAHINRGLVNITLKNYDAAVMDFNHVIRQEPKNSEAYYFRGVAYGRAENDDLAIASYSAAIRLMPNYPEAYYNRGLAHQRMGNTAQAKVDLHQAELLDPKLNQRMSRTATISAAR